MAKYFGMVIYTPHGPKGNGKRIQSVNSMANHAYYYHNNMKFYIHPDSVGLLEPKKDDIVTVHFDNGSIASDTVESVIRENDEQYPYMGNGLPVVHLESMHPDWWYTDKVKIIQRDGNVFHWPESEEV